MALITPTGFARPAPIRSSSLLFKPAAPSVASRTQPGTTPAPRAIAPRPAAPRPPAATPAPIPHFVPGALDPEAQAALNDINAKFQGLTGLLPGGGQVPGSIGQFQFDRNLTLRNLAEARIRALFDRGQGFERVTNDSAGRGVYNSGIRTKGLGDVAGATQLQLDQLFNQEGDANSLFDRQMTQAEADRIAAAAAVTRASDDRGLTNFLQNQPLPPPPDPSAAPAAGAAAPAGASFGVAPTAAPVINGLRPTAPAIFSYPQWLAYHKAARTPGFPTDLAALKIRYNNYVVAHSK